MEFPDFYTVDEIALATRTNRKSIYDAIGRGEIPAVRVGRVLRVPGSWLKKASGNIANAAVMQGGEAA